VRVAYAQHSGGETASWDDDKVEKEGGRPVIYVGTGSQAGFFDQAVFFQGKTGKQAGIGCDVASGPSRRVEVAALLVPSEVTDRADPFAWLSFHGRWGEKVSGELSGPTGPNDKGQWTQPFTWEEGLRDSSLKVPFGTAMGPNAAEASCAVVAFVSEFLFQNSPFLLIGLAVVAGGSIVITTTRTRFSPFVREPFRRRRRFGQTLSGAFTILLRRAPLFLGISLILVPLGIVASAIQGLIQSSPSVDPVVEFAGNVVFAGILALAIGALELGIAYWAVLLGVSAAIGRLEAGRPAGVAQAYRLVWDRIGTLLAARLTALAITAMLVITLVGIPWALLYGVRWAFLEHAILLEGKDAREAFTSSSDLVKGSWWRTLGALLVLAAIGIAIGPLVGLGLLLLGPAPLSAMNLISSSISFVLVPFAAIALALLYFDLRVQRGAIAEPAQGAHEPGPRPPEAEALCSRIEGISRREKWKLRPA